LEARFSSGGVLITQKEAFICMMIGSQWGEDEERYLNLLLE
jgi:hypothetical protein